jgi:hypothetical protein
MAVGGAGSFRYTVWDPIMIIAQMATLQSLYYVSLGLWIFIFDILQGSPRSIDQIFMYQVRKEKTYSYSSSTSRIFNACSIMLNSVKEITPFFVLFSEPARNSDARKVPHRILFI